MSACCLTVWRASCVVPWRVTVKRRSWSGGLAIRKVQLRRWQYNVPGPPFNPHLARLLYHARARSQRCCSRCPDVVALRVTGSLALVLVPGCCATICNGVSMESPGRPSTPIPDTHRWSKHTGWVRRSAAALPDAAQRDWLREVRWRREPLARGRLAAAVAATLLLHLALWFGLLRGSRWQPEANADRPHQEAIAVLLLSEPQAAPPAVAPQPPEPLPQVQGRPPSVTAPVEPAAVAEQSKHSTPATEGQEKAVVTARLFDTQGRVILPAASSSTAQVEYRSGALQVHQRPARPDSPVTFEQTEFDQYWVPENESILDTAVRKTTAAGTVLTLPGGTQIKCAISPLALAGGCGLAPPDQLNEPLKVEYKRNNLGSATPLIPPASSGSTDTPATPRSVVEPARSASALLPADEAVQTTPESSG